jgi:hypothetical protein
VSWEIPTGPVRLDPVLSSVVVVRHGGQLALLRVDHLIAYMPYPANLSSAGADLAKYPAPSAGSHWGPGSSVSATGVSGVGQMTSRLQGICPDCRRLSLTGAAPTRQLKA